MTDFTKIKLQAFNGLPPRPECNTLERAAYHQMFFIYTAHKKGLVTEQVAEQQTREARDVYERDSLIFQMYETGAKRQRAATAIGLEIETAGCPLCQQMMKIMDGRAPIPPEFR